MPNKGPAHNDCIEWKSALGRATRKKDSSSPVAKVPTYHHAGEIGAKIDASYRRQSPTKNSYSQHVCENIISPQLQTHLHFHTEIYHHPSPTHHLFSIGPTRLPILTGQASPPSSTIQTLPPKPCAFSPPTTPSTTAGTKSQQPTGSNTVPGTKNPPTSLPSTLFPATSIKERVSFVPNAS